MIITEETRFEAWPVGEKEFSAEKTVSEWRDYAVQMVEDTTNDEDLKEWLRNCEPYELMQWYEGDDFEVVWPEETFEIVEEEYLGIKNLNLVQDDMGYGFVEFYGLNIPMKEFHTSLAVARAGKAGGGVGFPERVVGGEKIDENFKAMSNTRKSDTRHNLRHPEEALDVLQNLIEIKVRACPYSFAFNEIADRNVIDVFKKDSLIGTFDAPNEGCYVSYFEIGILQDDLISEINDFVKDSSSKDVAELGEYLLDKENETMFKAKLGLTTDQEYRLSLGEIYSSKPLEKDYTDPKRDAVRDSESVGKGAVGKPVEKKI